MKCLTGYMATSTCSSTDSSNLPPIEFQFTTSVDSTSGTGLTVAVERCPLCDCSRRPFYCKTCVNEGKFIHSSATYPESYTDKKTKSEISKKTNQEILLRFEVSVSKHHELDYKQSAIEECRRKITLLKLALTTTKESIIKGKQVLDTNKKENILRHAKCKKHQEKMARIKNFIEQSRASKEKRQIALHEKMDELARTRHELVDRLNEYIFPVEEVKGKSVADSMALSTVSALRDASHTAFLRGKWVYTDGSGDVQYRIVEPTLPGSGDYSEYSLWVATSRENMSNPDYKLQNPGHRISAALCYCSQMLSVLSHILDFRLPRKQCYSEFCGSEMTEKRFESSVAALNYNILYLCFSQGITDTDILYPKNTLQNLLTLVNSPKLGRLCSFEVNEELMKSIDEICSSYEEDDEDKPSVFDEEGDLSPDWERVPVELPEMDMPTGTRSEMGIASTIQYTSYPHTSAESTQLSASALVTSAAASLVSFFQRASSSDKR